MPYPRALPRSRRLARLAGRGGAREQPALRDHPGACSRASCRPRSPRSSRATRPPRVTRSGSPISRWRWPRPWTAPTAGPSATSASRPTRCSEIRYASLLHDFGKVGVREEVLVKAKKLHPGQLELIRQRGEIIKRGLELRHARRKLDWLLLRRPRGLRRARPRSGTPSWPPRSPSIDQHLKAVAAANEPTVMPEDVAASHPRPGRCTPIRRSSGRLADADHAGRGPHPVDPAREPDCRGVRADPVARRAHLSSS